MFNINKWTRGRAIIPGRLEFAGGYPKYSLKLVRYTWGNNISFVWLGTELVWFGSDGSNFSMA